MSKKELSKKEFMRQYTGGARIFTDIKMLNEDFSMMRLNKLVFFSSEFNNVKFDNATLRISFKHCKVICCSFCEADIRKAQFYYSDLRDTDFSHADLRHTDFSFTSLIDVSLNKANLVGASFDRATWPLWCGAFDVQVDIELINQLAYHICSLKNKSKRYKEIKNFLAPYANDWKGIRRHCLKKIEGNQNER